MARLRRSHLPHEVTVTPFLGDSAEGDMWGEPVKVPAYVEQKTRLRVDRRSTSPTSGQEVTSTTMVIVLPQHDALPRTKVTVWEGTPRERTSEIVDTLGLDYPGTPSHGEWWLE